MRKLDSNEDLVHIEDLPLQELPKVLNEIINHLNLMIIKKHGYGSTEYEIAPLDEIKNSWED